MDPSSLPQQSQELHQNSIKNPEIFWPIKESPASTFQSNSSQQFLDNFTRNIGQPEVASLETIDQFRMIKPQQMENGRMKIMNMDFIPRCVESKIIRLSQGDTRLDPSACQPNGEAIGMMIPAIIAPLNHGCATELAPPDNQCILQHAPLFEILEQGCTGLICVQAVFLQITH